VIFAETKLKGAYVVEPERIDDERGFFARTFCQVEFEKYGLNPQLVQCNISFNKNRGTLRGMHYQLPPKAEAKLVRCTSGSIYDVIVDLRSDSSTFQQWVSVELTSENRRMVFVPEMVAHGFLTLADDTEVFYQMSQFYDRESARGIRWNDPAFGIRWPQPPVVISERDRAYPNFRA
jgi:dTDP-4-dehydrorhamnose 3,5-epimerase